MWGIAYKGYKGEIYLGKNDIRMKKWLSDKQRFSSLINGGLFGSKEIFPAETLHSEDREFGIVLQKTDEKETAVQKHRDIHMVSEDGTRIVVLACENQQKVHYAMVVRTMLYDALSYAEQVQKIQKERNQNHTWETSAEFLSGLKKDDLLHPVLTIVLYYGDEEDGWDACTDIHELTGLDQEEYKILQKYIPNYHINIIDPAKIEDLSCFNQDLQMVFGMLKYRKDKEQLKQYVEENKEYFQHVDDETYDAIGVMLGVGTLMDSLKDEEKEGDRDMCKAIEDIYNDGVMDGELRGKAEGKAESVLELLELYGDVPEKVRETVCGQKNLEVLKQWVVAAARVNAVDEFERMIAQ